MISNKINVFHFLFDNRGSGPLNYIKTLQSRHYENVNLMLIVNGKKTETSSHSLIKFNFYRKYLLFLEIFLNFFGILILKRKYDNVIFHVHGVYNLAPLLFAWVFNVKTIWHIHESASNLKFLFNIGRFFQKNSDNIFIASVSKKAAIEYGFNKYIYLPAVIDYNFWKSKEKIKKIDFNNINIFSSGNINPLKGHDLMLDFLEKSNLNFDIQIAGAFLSTQANFTKKIKTYIKKINNNNHKSCKVLGWVDSEKIKKCLSKCDIFFFPSRSEACPIALIEAMALNKIIVTNPEVGDIGIILQNYKNKIFYTNLDKLNLVEEIKSISIGISTFPMNYDINNLSLILDQLYKNIYFENFNYNCKLQ